jgi:dTDP-4-amino-4,6-dideoxy-D-glucose ammonia-lyase
MSLTAAIPGESARSRDVESCTRPDGDRAAAVAAVRTRLAALAGGTAPDHTSTAEHLVALAQAYAEDPFLPLEQVRTRLGAERPRFGDLLRLFGRIPELRTAVESGPAGKYWTNTILLLERSGAWSAALEHRPTFPRIVGLYPGPTCMFRCHFCVRVTGARYPQAALADGNALLASVIDEMPVDDPTALYVSGLEQQPNGQWR